MHGHTRIADGADIRVCHESCHTHVRVCHKSCHTHVWYQHHPLFVCDTSQVTHLFVCVTNMWYQHHLRHSDTHEHVCDMTYDTHEHQHHPLFVCARSHVTHIFVCVTYICTINTIRDIAHFIRCWYRVAKTHRIPYLYRSFSAKEPYI